MSERYITDRFLPDKAIDLIDEACSDVNLKDKNIIRRAELRKDLDDLKFERETLMSADAPNGEELTDEALDKRYERIAELRSKEMQREQELASLELEGVPELTIDNLARIIELWTKIPASSIREDEFERLAELDKRLKAPYRRSGRGGKCRVRGNKALARRPQGKAQADKLYLCRRNRRRQNRACKAPCSRPF